MKYHLLPENKAPIMRELFFFFLKYVQHEELIKQSICNAEHKQTKNKDPTADFHAHKWKCNSYESAKTFQFQ